VRRIIESSGATRSRLFGCETYPNTISPALLRAVSYQGVRHLQGWGAKPLGQCSHIRQDGNGDVNRRCDYKHHSGQELGWRGRVNTRESPLNVVKYKQAQGAGYAWTKMVGGQVLVLRTHQPQTVPHRRRGETYPTQANRRNVVSLLVSPRGVTAAQVTAMHQQVQDDGKSEGHAVIVWIGVATSPHAQAGRLPSGLSARERLANRSRRTST
jgi:hypothetical protein